MSENRGPSGYGVRELVYYGGFFAGIIVTYQALPGDIHSLIRAGIGLVVGLGVGYVADRVYVQMNSPPRGGDGPPPPQ